ncbi:AraC family transcriptional regulator [Sphingobium sp. EM0848]|uniref:helix-turn-helix transcriptional regulator n=1 Tax=Sphingobium sp. EM0848 TaxID=2743473 RepID=UPI00159C9DED|nr:AraC family transcriptional regulator [Sphingobium sp. EM0848]
MIEQTLVGPKRTYELDANFVLPGIDVQIRTYHREAPTHTGIVCSRHLLSVSLSGRPRSSIGRYIPDRRETEPLHLGNIIFVPGGVPVVGYGPGGVEQSLSCRFDFGAFPELAQFERDISEDWLRACGDIRAPQMKEMMRRLAFELRSPGFARETIIDLLVRAAIVDVVRCTRQPEEKKRHYSGGLSPMQLRRLTDYITNSLERSPTIPELARACDVSAGHLMRSFRQSTGETIHAHVQRIRIERAKLLLKEKRSVKETAYLLGFATPSGFAVAFKRLHGQTPSEFRRSASC